jgi:hypothetical protein
MPDEPQDGPAGLTEAELDACLHFFDSIARDLVGRLQAATDPDLELRVGGLVGAGVMALLAAADDDLASRPPDGSGELHSLIEAVNRWALARHGADGEQD